MKDLKIRKLLVGCGIMGAIFISAHSVSAQDVSGGFAVDVMSKYIWRGMESHNRVALQTDLNLAYKEFTVDFWSDYKTGEESGIDEVDFTLDYTKSFPLKIGEVSLSGGYIYYDMDSGDTQEVYLGASYSDKIANFPISLGATVYRDIDAVQSTYLELTGSTEIPIDKVTVSPYITFGYYEYDEGKDGWNNLEFGVDASMSLTKSIGAHALVAYSIGNEDLGLDNEFYGGVGVGFEF